MLEKKADTSAPIDDLLARRWSPRGFDPERPVSTAQRQALLEAARWAPSCYGAEPWRFVVCDRTTNPTAWEKAFDCLSDGNRAWVNNVSLLLLAVADTVFAHNDRPNRWGGYDTGAASENLCLQAVSLGLMAHQMGGFDAAKARAAFAVPERYAPMAMIAVGNQAPLGSLDEERRARETAARRRSPLGERFFDGAWDAPLG